MITEWKLVLPNLYYFKYVLIKTILREITSQFYSVKQLEKV